MGNGVSYDIGGDAHCSRGAAQDHSGSLCQLRDILGLSSPRVACMGDVGSKVQPEQRTCLVLLTALLETVAREVAYPLSVRLIGEFGSLAAVLAADEYALRRTASAFPSAIAFLLLIKQATRHSLAFALNQAPVIATGHVLRDYLFARLAHAKAEEFRVLFLDVYNRLICDELMGIGTIGQTTAYPREIIKRALELGAVGLILVHNHPSGDSTPSAADIALTRNIANACQHLELKLIDHVIIARSNWSSMRALGLL
jgi:DNA repair protein RadC